jgi:hypothetical protein
VSCSHAKSACWDGFRVAPAAPYTGVTCLYEKIYCSFVDGFFSQVTYSDEWYLIDSDKLNGVFDVQKIETDLWVFLGENKSHKFQEQSSYKYQYRFETPEIVNINAFCHVFTHPEIKVTVDFHKDFYQVFDGGSCYFQLNYNLKFQKFEGLYVNGES